MSDTGIAGALAELWRYPIKSMGGEALHAGTLTTRGVHGDRVYALVDHATGKVASAKLPRLWGGLLACRAALVSSSGADASTRPVQITLPDGGSATAPGPQADEALSALCARSVTLVATPPEQPEIDRYWPDIAGLALRDTITSGPISTGAAPGTFFDYAPLHLLTTASLARLGALYPAGALSARRFRPNLVIAPADETSAFAENTWVGRTLVIGGQVRLRVITPTPRCVVPTLPQPDLPQDLGILRTIVAHNKVPIPLLDGSMQASLGVYAVVERGGPVRVGDPVFVEPLEM